MHLYVPAVLLFRPKSAWRDAIFPDYLGLNSFTDWRSDFESVRYKVPRVEESREYWSLIPTLFLSQRVHVSMAVIGVKALD